MSKIEIQIISGYLGAGKTTLLKAILPQLSQRTVGLIINDFAVINVDAKELKQPRLSRYFTHIIEFSSGPIDQARIEMENALLEMKEKGIDLILIECSGVANLSQLLRNITKRARLRDHFDINNVSVVVDAYVFNELFCRKQPYYQDNSHTISQAMIKQIEYANTLVLNKSDLIDDSEADKIVSLLGSFNPKANIYITLHSNLNVKNIIKTFRFQASKALLEDDDTESLEYASQLPHSFLYKKRIAFNPRRFNQLLDHWPEGIIRCKGVAWFGTVPNNVYKISQAGSAIDITHAGYWIASLDRDTMMKMFEVREGLKELWHPQFGDRVIELIFIGYDMNEKEIVRQLDECLYGLDEPIVQEPLPF